MMAKVEAIKIIISQRAELMQLYKEDKEWDALPNNNDTMNKEDDDMGYESENCGEPWKNHKDKKCMTNKELEVVLQKKFEENTVWDFSYLKTWFNQENFFPLYIVHVVKFVNYGLRKKTYYVS